MPDESTAKANKGYIP